MSRFINFYVDYGEFHDNTVNKIIHLICIPVLTFSLAGLLQKLPGVDILLLVITAGLSLRADVVCGSITTIWVLLLFFWARHLYSLGVSNGIEDEVYRFFIWQNVLAWIAQIIGHSIFEKRSPALTSNITLMLSAPFFVTAEVLAYFGWRKDDFKKINQEISSRIKTFRNEKLKAKAN